MLGIVTGGGFTGGGGRNGVGLVSTGVLVEFVVGVTGLGELEEPGGDGTEDTELLGAGLECISEVPDGGGSNGNAVILLKTIERGMSYPRGMFSSKLVVKNAIPAFPIPCTGPPFTFSHPVTGGEGR